MLVTELLITIGAASKMILSNDPVVISAMTGFIVACFGAVGTTLGFYFTANVVQKKVGGNDEGKNSSVGIHYG